MLKGGSTYRFVTDQLGSVRAVVDVLSGAIVQEIAYDAWGNATLVSGTWDVQPFGFAGGLYDELTGLVRFGARDYDSEVGRWSGPEPLLFDGDGPNLYSYTRGDPVNHIDPSGTVICQQPNCPPPSKLDCYATQLIAGGSCIAACTEIPWPTVVALCIAGCLAADAWFLSCEEEQEDEEQAENEDEDVCGG